MPADTEKKLPAVVVTIQAGVVQFVATSEAMDVLVVNYDDDVVEDLPPSEITLVHQRGKALNEVEPAQVYLCGSNPDEIQPEHVNWRVAKYNETNGKEA
ncbi:hypothetical protein [Dyella telluris]|uniref:Uncharacterized protein n=1 Tax=Dyella telluris TaxID=2763498 RepID=A0A7G8Q4J4_9GAMM|nr:hypothetical protein [Dyella telluris]QNK01702.1 hypothetical protein H8F01_00535 [Dyella telluris]